MSKYFLEVRNRFVLVCLSILFSFITCYCYKEILLFVLIQPDLCISKSFSGIFYFIFTNITELFHTYLQLVLFISLQISLLYFILHTFIFLSLAMFKNEYKTFKLCVKIMLLVWFFSIIFSNFFLIPLSWDFFLGFQELALSKFLDLHFEAKLNEYLSFYISLYWLCAFYCQIFTILFFFITFTNFYSIKRFRKVYYYVFLVFSTLISPPDVFSQFIISMVIISIYELIIFSLIFFKNISSVTS